MGLMDFIKKQFIDVIEWTESGEGLLAYRFPMADNEIQYGASLTVRESQIAVFVNEGKVADVFGPGRYKLETNTLPVLTYLKNWDKLFQSPFKSDVYFFSTRQQLDRRWGTTQPVTIRDKDFGAVRLRAFGNYAYRIKDAKVFHSQISGTRERYTAAELDDLFATHPELVDAAATGYVKDKSTGEEHVLLLVVPKDKSMLTNEREMHELASRLHTWVGDKTAYYKWPSTYLFADSAPRNPTGKLLRKDIAATKGHKVDIARQSRKAASPNLQAKL